MHPRVLRELAEVVAKSLDPISAGIEFIFLSVTAVFWICYEKNVDNNSGFSCCYDIKDLFPVSHIHLLSRCAGVRREDSQMASPSWPKEIFHTMDLMLSLGMGVVHGTGSSLCSSRLCEFESLLVQEFKFF